VDVSGVSFMFLYSPQIGRLLQPIKTGKIINKMSDSVCSLVEDCDGHKYLYPNFRDIGNRLCCRLNECFFEVMPKVCLQPSSWFDGIWQKQCWMALGETFEYAFF